VIAFGVGGYIGYRYDFWIDGLKAGLAEDLERHGRSIDVYNKKFD